mmetsp:Transcript_59905/g.165807  ORF Transcript_59905/g.165807 Transcript_59905/m.165807 type:complete len:379 (+) Transcript_59905:674-1810(+)
MDALVAVHGIPQEQCALRQAAGTRRAQCTGIAQLLDACCNSRVAPKAVLCCCRVQSYVCPSHDDHLTIVAPCGGRARPDVDLAKDDPEFRECRTPLWMGSKARLHGLPCRPGSGSLGWWEPAAADDVPNDRGVVDQLEERDPAVSQQLPSYHPESPHIALLRIPPPFQRFGGEVAHRPRPSFGIPMSGGVGVDSKPKVRNLDRGLGDVVGVVAEEQHVPQREVAVDEPGLCQGLHPRAHLLQDRHSVPERQSVLDRFKCRAHVAELRKLHHQQHVSALAALAQELHEPWVPAKPEQRRGLRPDVSRVHLEDRHPRRGARPGQQECAPVHPFERACSNELMQLDGRARKLSVVHLAPIIDGVAERYVGHKFLGLQHEVG